MEATKFDLTFFVGSSYERLAKKIEKKLNQFVEHRLSLLGDDQEKNKSVYINLSKLTMHSRNLRENFAAI